MASDFSIYDLRRSFTVHEAALAWAETEHESENLQRVYQAIYAELLGDVKSNQIPHRIKRDIRKNWINWESDYSDRTDWSKAEIWAEDLKRWAESRGQKPKFLFPEMRVAVVTKTEQVPQEKAEPKPLPPRENRMHGLLERVCLDLFAQYKRWPQAKEVLQALEQEENNPDRSSKYDPDGIIQEIKGTTIYWQSDGADEPKMELKTLQNRIGILKENHKTQKAKRKIPA
jgi:hypothetical protein